MSNRKFTFPVVLGLGVIAIGLAVYAITAPFRELQSGSSAEVAQGLPVLSTVPEFTLTQEDGTPITLADLKGKIWVADLIFTRCEGICPIMSKNFSKLQQALTDKPEIKLVSFSVDPEHDVPDTLSAYAAKYGADKERWRLVTGARPTIFELAKKGFLLGVDSNSLSADHLVTHSEKFVLIDKAGNMRAYYEGTNEASIPKILNDIDLLLTE